MIAKLIRSDFTGREPEQKVWRKFNDVLPSLRAQLERDPILSDFASSAYASRYWKRGSGERRFPWIGFVHRDHLKEYREREICTQFQFGPTFWSIWIDYPATAARRNANEMLGEFPDTNLREYFNAIGDEFASKLGYGVWASLQPHRDRSRSDMNDFEKNLYGKERYWEMNLSQMNDQQTHQFVVGIKQPRTGVNIGAEPSTEELVTLSEKGTLIREIAKVTKALLPVYLLLTGIETPRGLKRGGTRSRHESGRKGGHILSTTTIDESARWAVERAMKHERDEGRTPVDVSGRVVHYDVESSDKDGKVVRLIEVKGRRGSYPVVLTSGEFKEARKKKQDYFLYVITGDHEGFALQNPATTSVIEERLVKVYEVKNWREKARQFSI